MSYNSTRTGEFLNTQLPQIWFYELIRARTDKDKQKANTKYQNMMEQYEERQPLNERMRQSRQENIQTGAKKENNYALELQFFTMAHHIKVEV